MDLGIWLNMLPLWVMFFLTLVLCIAAVEAGAALARYSLRNKQKKEPEAPLGSLVGAVLGLLAFILAFTFGMTATRFDYRKQLVLEESNAIGTTYLPRQFAAADARLGDSEVAPRACQYPPFNHDGQRAGDTRKIGAASGAVVEPSEIAGPGRDGLRTAKLVHHFVKRID